MATEILPVASGADDSDDVVVAAGTPLTVALKEAEDDASVTIYLKDDDGGYNQVGALVENSGSATVIAGPGTYRFSRDANGKTCGVFSG